MRKFGVILLFISFSLSGQDLQVLLANSEEIDPVRYDGVRGSAYYFDDFVKGKIITNSAETFEDMTLNYNAETQEFEIVNEEGKTIQLYKPMYMRVEVHPEDNPELNLTFPIIFQRGFNMKWFDRFGQMVYDGDKVKLVKDYLTEIEVNEVNNVGNTVKFKRFKDSEAYYLLIEGELTSVKLKKKKILGELTHASELENYARENKIDFSDEAGVRKLLAYYESIN